MEIFYFQTEDGKRNAKRSQGRGDVYKRERCVCVCVYMCMCVFVCMCVCACVCVCFFFLLFTSDAADVSLGVFLRFLLHTQYKIFIGSRIA